MPSPRRKPRGRCNAWWKKYRQKAPKLFAEELQLVRRRIEQEPDLGQVYAIRRGVVVRRILMEKTRTHVFYEVMGNEPVILIVALWGATKERGPDLDE